MGACNNASGNNNNGNGFQGSTYMTWFPAAFDAIVSTAGYYRTSDHSNNSCIFIDISIKISHSRTKGAWNSMKFLWRGVCKFTMPEKKTAGAYFKMSQTNDRTHKWFDTFCVLVLFMIFQFRQITNRHLLIIFSGSVGLTKQSRGSKHVDQSPFAMWMLFWHLNDRHKNNYIHMIFRREFQFISTL